MKLINPVGRNVKLDTQAYYGGINPMDGCICSGSAAVSADIAKSRSGGGCACYCAGGDANRVANFAQAYIA
ncbi:RumC family sactipeptide [Paenibacillus sp. FSL K6-1230]